MRPAVRRTFPIFVLSLSLAWLTGLSLPWGSGMAAGSPDGTGVFYLRSGERIEGEVIRETEGTLELRIPYGTVLIEKKDVLPGPPPEIVRPAAGALPPVTPLPEVAPPGVSLPEMAPLTEEESAMLQWLKDRQQPTGLLASFFPTADEMLTHQAATYDQALAGLTFLYLGRLPEARALADFFVANWRERAYINFYHAVTGKPGIEHISHLGPNTWVGLFMLQLYQATGTPDYLMGAERIIQWGLQLPVHLGASAMSDRDESRAPWSEVFSTENNIDFYALLELYLKIGGGRIPTSVVERRRDGILDFFHKHALRQDEEGLLHFQRGGRKNKLDPVQALDTYSWLLLALRPEVRLALQLDEHWVVQSLEDKFQVTDEGIIGFDFTDAVERQRIPRAPVVTVEWTCGVIAVYRMLALEDSPYRRDYLDRSDYYLEEMRKCLLPVKKGSLSLPYATRPRVQVFKDPEWWATPQDAKYSRAGSVASVTWYLISTRVNPFRPYDAD